MNELLACKILFFFKMLELLLTLCFTNELGWNRVWKYNNPGRQEQLTSRNQKEERKGNKLDHVSLYLLQSLLLFVRCHPEAFTPLGVFWLDSPFHVSSKCLKSMDHVSNTMVNCRHSLPEYRVCYPEQIDRSTKLPFKKMGTLVCNCSFAPPTNIFDECNSVIYCEPYSLLDLFYHTFIRVNLLVFILVPVRSLWFEERLFFWWFFTFGKCSKVWLIWYSRYLVLVASLFPILMVIWCGSSVSSNYHRGSIWSTKVL